MVKRKGGKRKGKGNKADREKASRRLELSRELDMGELNARRLREAWRERMKSMNLPIIKENLEAAWRAFDRAIDNKNYTISLLMDGLDSAEEQKRRSESLHLEAVDEMIRNYAKLVRSAESRYQAEVDEALGDACGFTDAVESGHKEEELFLRTTMFATRSAYEHWFELLRTKNSSRLDTRKEEYKNEMGVTKTLLSNQMRSLLDKNVKILQDYEESTKDKRKEYNALKLRHEEDQRTIARQSRRIEKSLESVREVKNAILELRRRIEKDVLDYVFERDYFYGAYLRIQKRQLAEQAFDKEQLRVSTVEYNKTAMYLQDNFEKVEKILSMVTLCEKYETYDDKIMIFPISVLDDESQCRVMHKLLGVIKTVQRDIDDLKNKLKESMEESSYLKESLRLYMNTVLHGRENEPCGKDTKPIEYKLKTLIHY